MDLFTGYVGMALLLSKIDIQVLLCINHISYSNSKKSIAIEDKSQLA